MSRFIREAQAAVKLKSEYVARVSDVGTFENGAAKGRWTILPGTSTGALQGISGEGYFDAMHDSATYTLEVSF